MGDLKIDIVIPVYNEDENICQTLDSITQLIHTPHRVSIVYDFDEDSTLPVVKAYQDKNPSMEIRLVKSSKPGAINALKTGFAFAEHEAVLVVMADCCDDLSSVNAMVEHMKAGSDIVCGSRYSKGGKQHGGPWFKKTLSRLAGLGMAVIGRLPAYDGTNSYKLYRRSFIQSVNIESEGGFEIGLEMVVKAHRQGFKITEVPTQWYDREAGESRFQLFKWLPNYLRWFMLALVPNFAANSPAPNSGDTRRNPN